MIKRECKGDLRMKLPKDNQMNVYVCMWKNTVNEGHLAFWLGIRPLRMPIGPRRIGVGTEENKMSTFFSVPVTLFLLQA